MRLSSTQIETRLAPRPRPSCDESSSINSRVKREEEFVLGDTNNGGGGGGGDETGAAAEKGVEKRSPFNTRMKKMGFNPKLVTRLRQQTREKELRRKNR